MKIHGLFTRAKSSTTVVALLAVMAGTQLAALASDYFPYEDGWQIGFECVGSPSLLACVEQKCKSKYTDAGAGNGDECGFSTCFNGAIDYFNSHTPPHFYKWRKMICHHTALDID